jgi:HEAT repeat protein
MTAAPADRGAREPIVWPLAGFDSDLLARDELAKHLRSLPLPLVRQGLVDGRVAVRANALTALGLHGPPAAADLDLVLVMLRDASASVRRSAAAVLAGCEPADRVLAALLRALSADEGLRAEASAAVQRYGVRALPPLMAALRCDAAEADRVVLPLVVLVGPAAVQALGTALVHPDARVRAHAVAGLMLLGVPALQGYLPALAVAARDPEPQVRTLARQAQTMVSRAASPPFLEVRPLPIDDFAIRPADEAELKRASKQFEATALLALTRDGRETVRLNAWRSLATLGPLDAAATLQAGVACRDSDAAVRREAVLALKGCAEGALAQVLPQILLACHDTDKGVVVAARQCVLGQGKRVLPLLVAELANRSSAIQEAATQMLARHETDAVPLLRAALASDLPHVRENAVVALTAIGGKPLDEAATELVRLAMDSSDAVRLQAFVALAQLSRRLLSSQAPTWRPWGRQRASADPSLAVRGAAQAFVAVLDGVAPP